jgi:hypothetical protein
MAESTQVGFEPIDVEPAATIAAATGSYILLGYSAQPLRNITIQNWCDQPLMFSFNATAAGVFEDNFCLLPNAFWTFDIATNQSLTQGLFLDNNRPVYVRSMVAEGYGEPTTGFAWFSGCYAIDYPQD